MGSTPTYHPQASWASWFSGLLRGALVGLRGVVLEGCYEGWRDEEAWLRLIVKLTVKNEKIKKDSGASQLATAKFRMQSDREDVVERGQDQFHFEEIPFAKEEWAFS